jgi:hypothetical protein
MLNDRHGAFVHSRSDDTIAGREEHPMADLISAVRFRNLDEARQLLREMAPNSTAPDIFDDNGQEPQGLLAVIPQDRLNEEIFYRLFDQKSGVVVQVEKIAYSGYGPPAEETEYMGFTSEQVAYVVEGSRLPIEIQGCANGAVDIHHLEALVLDQLHPLNREDLARRLELNEDWEFEDLFELILERQITAQEIDRLIHQGIQ